MRATDHDADVQGKSYHDDMTKSVLWCIVNVLIIISSVPDSSGEESMSTAVIILESEDDECSISV